MIKDVLYREIRVEVTRRLNLTPDDIAAISININEYPNIN